MRVAQLPGVGSSLEEARRLLLDEGADAEGLYRVWFHRRTGKLTTWPDRDTYRATLVDRARFEPGWRVLDSAPGPAGAVLARRAARERSVAPPEMVPADPRKLSLTPGSEILVLPLASGEGGGFWHVWSVGWQRAMPGEYRRVYCPLVPAGALAFAAHVSEVAPANGTWAIKLLCGPHDAGRRDGALLYLPTGTSLTSRWMTRLLAAVGEFCNGELPPFVEPLGRGLGWAPDPGGGRSFGEAVSAAVASAAEHAGDAHQFAAVALAAVRELPGMSRRALSAAP
jgi:hypothetical protein